MWIGIGLGWLLFGIITLIAAEKKGRSGCGWFALGVLLGPFGFIIALLADPIEDSSDDLEKKESHEADVDIASSKINVLPEDYLGEPTQLSDVETHGCSGEFVLGWPIQHLRSELEITKDESLVKLEFFEIRNVTSEQIKYFEWEITCFDILDRIIETVKPIILKIEHTLEPGESLLFSSDVKLPHTTRNIQVRLLNTLYESGKVVSYEQEPLRKINYNTISIIDYFKTNPEFLSHLKTYYDLALQPNYLHEVSPEGYWLCAFCGVLNIPTSHECQCCGSAFAIQRYFRVNNISETYTQYQSEQETLQREKEYEAQLKKKRRRKNFIIVISIIVLFVVAGFVLWKTVLEDAVTYRSAQELFEKGEYWESANKFRQIPEYKDSLKLSLEVYLQYIEASVEYFNSLEEIFLVDAYDWLYTNAFEKEKIFLSIRNNFERMSKTNQESILSWLDNHDFHEFLPTITLVAKDEQNKEQVLRRMQQQSFLEGMLVPVIKGVERYGYKPAGWVYVIGDSSTVFSYIDPFKSINDETLFVHWEPLQIGDVGPAGGIVFYDKGKFTGNWRFIEVAPRETEWIGISNLTKISSDTRLTTPLGLARSQPSVFQTAVEVLPVIGKPLDTKKASNLVAELEVNGFNDWVLPSREELEIIYNRLYLRGIGSFMNTKYWSSTEKDFSSTWIVDFSNGSVIPYENNNLANIRAIRYF